MVSRATLVEQEIVATSTLIRADLRRAVAAARDAAATPSAQHTRAGLCVCVLACHHACKPVCLSVCMFFSFLMNPKPRTGGWQVPAEDAIPVPRDCSEWVSFLDNHWCVCA